MALVISFTQTGLDVTEPLKFIGLTNFQRLLGDPMFYQVLGTTLIYLFGVVPPIVIGALTLAVLVNRILPGVHILRAAFYTPVLVSIVVAAIAFRWLYAENGLNQRMAWRLIWSRIHPHRFFNQSIFSPSLSDARHPVERFGLLHGDLSWEDFKASQQELYEAAELDGSEGWRKAC